METTQAVYQPFHLAIPSNDLDKSREFYGQVLGCQEGRTAPGKWIDYNFYGSQLVAHFADSSYVPIVHHVAGLPVPNFGVFLSATQYAEAKSKLSNNNISFETIKGSSEGISQILIVKDLTGNHLLLHLQAEQN